MNIQEIITRMTLGDKISLCTGGDFWHSKAMERYGIPSFCRYTTGIYTFKRG